ncbi:curli production assembly/transport component CsgF [Candidatus Poribacteria bacterium]|nr:curli production assembly/transport component CsgF [Candidatus Poribacteria bacterium]
MVKKTCLYLLMSITILAFVGTAAEATQLVWTPVNPSFGGSPYNGTWLLNSAQLQNKLREPIDYLRETRDPLEDFEYNLNRQVLNRLSQKVLDGAFGEEALEAGHYEVGNYIIDINTGLNGVSVSIADSTTGDTVDVEVPYY